MKAPNQKLSFILVEQNTAKMNQDNNFLDDNYGPKPVPTFLKVLCIITFVVSGLGFLGSLFGFLTFNADLQMAQMEEAIVQMENSFAKAGNPFGSGFMEWYKNMLLETIENYRLNSGISLLSALLSVVGAFFMFRLQKIGFHLYVVSCILSLSTIFLFTISPLVTLTYVLSGIFLIAFIIMYATNLKHMS